VHWVSYKNFSGFLQVLHKQGYSLSDTDNFGMTPLHRAASSDARDTCSYLIQHSPQCLTLQDEKQRSPEAVAKEYSALTTYKLLREHVGPDSKTLFDKLSRIFYLLFCVLLYVSYYQFVSSISSVSFYTETILFHVSFIISLMLLMTARQCSGIPQGTMESLEKLFVEPFEAEKFSEVPHVDQICYTCMSYKTMRSQHCEKC